MKRKRASGLFIAGCAALAAAAVLRLCAPGLPAQIREAFFPSGGAELGTGIACFGEALSEEVGIAKAFSMLLDAGSGRA